MRSGLTIYDDHSHGGLLRYIQLVVERRSGSVQVVVVTNSTSIEPARALFRELEATGIPLQGVFWNGQPQRANTILGPHWLHVAGEPMLVEQIGGAEVCFPPGAFGQANPVLFDAIVRQIQGWVGHGQSVLEMYAGVGAIGLGLLRNNRVVFNERSAEAARGLTEGLRRIGDRSTQAELLVGDAFSVFRSVLERQGEARPRHVIVDPPRRGLGSAVLAGLRQLNADQLIYVSCGLPSFLRDADVLLDSGFCLNACHGYALFPFTDHVETLARFVRVGAER
jgi:23S rRNA (uracil1939-C5)-methyltransferase